MTGIIANHFSFLESRASYKILNSAAAIPAFRTWMEMDRSLSQNDFGFAFLQDRCSRAKEADNLCKIRQDIVL